MFARLIIGLRRMYVKAASRMDAVAARIANLFSC